MKRNCRIALTGFMGVGKSSVARHLASALKCQQLDLDRFIEKGEGRSVAEIIDQSGVDHYRDVETSYLDKFLARPTARILSLGGGTWTLPRNRELLRENGFITIWLESSFEHCWLNISFSRKKRPLAADKTSALKLFKDREKDYSLAEWHVAVRPGLTSFEIARQIAEELDA